MAAVNTRAGAGAEPGGHAEGAALLVAEALGAALREGEDDAALTVGAVEGVGGAALPLGEGARLGEAEAEVVKVAGGAHGPAPPGSTTRTRANVESAMNKRPYMSMSIPRGEASAAAVAGRPSP